MNIFKYINIARQCAEAQ